MSKISWDKFINENRAEIDEYLGPNNAMYTTIALKGRLATAFNDKVRTFDYFRALMETGMTVEEQNVYFRELLEELRVNNRSPPDPQMKFGINTKLLMGIDRLIFTDIIVSETF